MELLQETISRLAEHLRSSLEVLAMPHWIDLRIASKDKLPEINHWPALNELGLMQSVSGEQVRVVSPVRQFLLDKLALNQRPRYGDLSRRYYEMLSAVERPAIELYIEAQYHRLAVYESAAAAQLFRDAVALHSEPIFAFETLRRLLQAWREQEQREVLSSLGKSYLRVAELFDPAEGRPAKDEVDVLLPIAQSRKIADPAFQAEVNLRLGLAEMALGDLAPAQQALDAARADYGEAKIARGTAEVERAMGRLHLKTDRYREALQQFVKALDGFRELKLPIGVAQCQKSIAEIAGL